MLRANVARLNLLTDFVDELIEVHTAVVFEKRALVFCEGNPDGMLSLHLKRVRRHVLPGR